MPTSVYCNNGSTVFGFCEFVFSFCELFVKWPQIEIAISTTPLWLAPMKITGGKPDRMAVELPLQPIV